MASRRAHDLTGWAAGVAAAAWVLHENAGGPYHLLAPLTIVAGYLGGTAPDTLEQIPFAKGKRWCTHRTITHWVPAWVTLCYWTWRQVGTDWWWGPLLGFAGAGLVHLLIDWPNPLGVPILWSRHSLKLWKSGRADSVVVVVCWLASVWIFDRWVFGSVHFQRALALLSAA